MKIFCLSIYNNNYEKLKKLDLIPVGLGNADFNSQWLNDKGILNISKKNKNFGEYTFHYHLWKNILVDKHFNDWIGFCSYRRFWTNKSEINVKSFEDLNKIIVKHQKTDWNKFDVVLGDPLVFNKIKNIKLIKRNFLEVIKKPSVLFRKNSLMDQFKVFHGSFFLEKSLNFLSNENKINFETFLNNYELNPYNMFICKNSKILNQFYNEIFPWLLKCEEEFKNINLRGYNKTRIYGFLAERFMPYWFKRNFKTTTCPITFFETNKI
ncbi:DUF4422 domain-containing protein [Candidatus Pelagibacter sp.]|nr:DUF4422 domain-containing protein [Candidatus Pelagibacter sp.]